MRRAWNTFWRNVLVGLIAGVALSASAFAQERVALVIGNGAYRNHPQLANTTADARLIERTLQDLGFDVELLLNADGEEMERSFLRLNERLKAAGPEAVGLFYYAGHGVQSQGLNYLIPVDSTARVEPEVWSQAPRLGLLLDYLADAGNAANFIILDACRDSPLPAAGRAGAGSGLARLSAGATRGTLIAYATEPGRTASDGPGLDNSPYASALAELMPTPGWTAETLFRQIATRVEDTTAIGGVPAQSPWYENGLRGEDFCFAGCGQAAFVAPDPALPELDDDARDWERLSAIGSADALNAYVALHPGGRFADEASQRLSALVSVRDGEAEIVDENTAASIPRSPGEVFRDCDLCPEMVAIPAGRFVMGSTSGEVGIASDIFLTDDEGPQHTVQVPAFAASVFEVKVQEWQAFADATGWAASRDCVTFKDSELIWESDQTGTWSEPGFEQGPDHPVVCVSWDDAQSFVAWLSRQTGARYRLLTEAEWEYAARANASGSADAPAYAWGPTPDHEHANFGGECCVGSSRGFVSGRDQWEKAAPVGQFPPNAFGLFDMHGNVGEWVQDCYENSYDGAPLDGSAADPGFCAGGRIARGGSWGDIAVYIRAASREPGNPALRLSTWGLRIARDL